MERHNELGRSWPADLAIARGRQDIRNRKIDAVVVYKVDRLTRALMDFAKIVETFDQQGVSCLRRP